MTTYRRLVPRLVRETLASGKPVNFTVRGDSMAPTLGDGDQVRIVSADPSALQPGNVVAYISTHGCLIMHRVVNVDNETIVTKGDNREKADPAIPLARVLGKVEAGGESETQQRDGDYRSACGLVGT